jgi:hypothetical protein
LSALILLPHIRISKTTQKSHNTPHRGGSCEDKNTSYSLEHFSVLIKTEVERLRKSHVEDVSTTSKTEQNGETGEIVVQLVDFSHGPFSDFSSRQSKKKYLQRNEVKPLIALEELDDMFVEDPHVSIGSNQQVLAVGKAGKSGEQSEAKEEILLSSTTNFIRERCSLLPRLSNSHEEIELTNFAVHCSISTSQPDFQDATAFKKSDIQEELRRTKFPRQQNQNR